MAGLLDIFGTGGVETMGLLGMSPQDIQKSRDSAQAQALFALAGRMFQGGRGGQSILEGLQQGQQAYSQAMQGGLQQQLQSAQLQEMLRKRKEDEARREQEKVVRSLAPYALQEQVIKEGMPAQPTLYGKPTQFPLLDDEGNVMPEAGIIPARPAETTLVPNQAVIGKLQEMLPFKDFENLMQGIERRQKLNQPDYVTVDKTILKKTPMGLEPVYKGNDYLTVDGSVYLKDDTAKNGLALVVGKAGKFTGDFANLSQGMFKTDNPQDLTTDQFNQLLDRAKSYKKSGAGGDIINYPAGAVPVGKEAQNAIDKAALSTGERLSRLNRIETSYDPKFLETKFRSVQDYRAIGEKLGLTKLTPEQKQQLTNYTQFSQDSIRELNQYIVDITGAAMGTGEEADRIKKGMPNVGSGLLDGDSPTQFAAKLSNTLRDLRTMEARLQYIKANGLKIVDVPLDRMPEIMRQREQALITSLGLDVKNPQDRAVLKSRLASEFGLMR
jgi:hypothetical protein